MTSRPTSGIGADLRLIQLDDVRVSLGDQGMDIDAVLPIDPIELSIQGRRQEKISDVLRGFLQPPGECRELIRARCLERLVPLRRLECDLTIISARRLDHSIIHG